jgi:hypothetical protein
MINREQREGINAILKVVMLLSVTVLPGLLIIDNGSWQVLVIGNLRAFFIPLIIVTLAQLLGLRNTYGVWCLRNPAARTPGKTLGGLLRREVIGLIILLGLVMIILNLMVVRHAQDSFNEDPYMLPLLFILIGLVAAYLILLDRYQETHVAAYGTEASNSYQNPILQNTDGYSTKRTGDSPGRIAENYLVLWCVIAELVFLICCMLVTGYSPVSYGSSTVLLLYTGIVISGIVALFWAEKQYISAMERSDPARALRLQKIPARVFLTGILAAVVMLVIGRGISGLAAFEQARSLPVLGAVVAVPQTWLMITALFFSPALVFVIYRPRG